MISAQTPIHLFSCEEHVFLSRMFAQYPALAENFARYLSAPPDLRPAMAEQDVAALPRAGWVLRHIDNPETVQLHMDYVARYAESEAPAGLNRERCRALGAVHDLPEAIVTDFTPGNSPSKADKSALELLAVRVIFQSSPLLGETMSLMREYQAQETPEAKWVRDVDLLDPCFVALQYEARQPGLRGLFNEFAAYAGPRLTTGEGRAIHGDLYEHQDTYRESHKTVISTAPRGPWAGR